LNHRLNDTDGKSDHSTLMAPYAMNANNQRFCLSNSDHAIRRLHNTASVKTISARKTARSVGLPSSSASDVTGTLQLSHSDTDLEPRIESQIHGSQIAFETSGCRRVSRHSR